MKTARRVVFVLLAASLVAAACDDLAPLDETPVEVLDTAVDDGSGDVASDTTLPDALEVEDDTGVEPDAEDVADTGADDTHGDDATDTVMPDLVEDDASAEVTEPDLSDTTEPPPVDPCADQDTPPPAPGTRKAINDDPAFIQVYVNNIENLKLAGEQCPGDWTDLIYYMKTVEPSPDLFLVQQISDRAQLDLLIDRMDRDLPGVFAGVIADADPWTQQSPCGPEKAQQTNAIIYRKGRFEPVGSKHVWQSWANKNDACVRNHQARTRNVMLKLHDKVANKDVTVASVHWATAQGGGPDPACALANILEAGDKVEMAGYRSDLAIVGGDLNESDRNAEGGFRPWYRRVNGDRGGALNFRDPVFRQCDGAGLQGCLDDNWTVGSERRIDFLFARDGNGCRAGTRRAHTITFDEADDAARQLTGSDSPLNYSDHRAIRSEVYY